MSPLWMAATRRSNVLLCLLVGLVCFSSTNNRMLTTWTATAFPIVASRAAMLSRSTSRVGALRHLAARRSNTNSQDDEDDDDYLGGGGYKKPTVNWYPGHIAKAERQLAETLRAVDVVVEVRDARACKATSHGKVGEWCAGRPRIVVLTHVDQIPKASLLQWKHSYETLGAGRWDGHVTAQIRNQAIQAAMERGKYDPQQQQAYDDSVAKLLQQQQGQHVVSPVENVLFVDAKQGQGIHAITRAIFRAGAHVQERRERRGLKERALRVGVIGYPNVGKSALINRILGRRRARTANTPGVTRALQWIRVKNDDTKTTKKEFELLDSPGVIPANLVDQNDALLLAACNCIGQAAYDNQAVAAFLCEWLKALHLMGKGSVTSPGWRTNCKTRYGFDPLETITKDGAPPSYRTGEDMLHQVADNTCQGDPEDAARKILQDFRSGRMGPVCVQLAPETESDPGQQNVRLATQVKTKQERRKQQEQNWFDERQERARLAMETAKQQGLELPPILVEQTQAQSEQSTTVTSDDANPKEVGKGVFEGW